jgi:hypothetical protein
MENCSSDDLDTYALAYIHQVQEKPNRIDNCVICTQSHDGPCPALKIPGFANHIAIQAGLLARNMQHNAQATTTTRPSSAVTKHATHFANY